MEKFQKLWSMLENQILSDDGEYSNSWYSYAWMTARKLNAQIHDTSQGGISLLDDTGWFAAPHYKGVESCYDKIEYHPDLGPTKPWDFSRYIPHVVVVAIGQNDNHPVDYMAEDYDSEKSKNWRKHYQAFIEKLMQLYPKAQIILATTILCHDKSWDRSIDEVCTRIGSERVHHFLYTKMAPARRDTSASRKQSRCRMSLRRISTH